MQLDQRKASYRGELMSQIPVSETRSLMAAGASALRFNSPLSEHRPAALTDSVLLEGAANLVDFGCGKGELLLLAVQRHAHIRGDRDRS